MSARFDFGRRKVLSHRERDRIKRDIDLMKRTIGGEIVVPTNRHIRESDPTRRRMKYSQHMDPLVRESRAELIKAIKKKENVLRNSEAPSLSRHERAKLEAQARKDRLWLQRRMTPRNHVNLKHDPLNPAFEKSVQNELNNQVSKEFQTVSNRYKNTMRTISDDPTDSNLEKIRPNR